MKKIFLTTLLITMIFLTGCGSANESKIRNNFIKDTNKLDGYYLEGVMNLTNNDDTYQYDVEVSYKQKDYYKVVLTNNANDYSQIILKNDDGVYVITPSLNKSFKFQSEWPYNNSQSYLLHSVATDLSNDDDYTFELKNNEYIFTTKANYPNNKELVKQNITLDKDGNLKKVEVLNKDNIPLIEFTVTSIDKKATFKDDYFSLDNIVKNMNDCTGENCNNLPNATESDNTEEQTVTEKATIKETIFPLYLPDNTTLKDKEVIQIDNGERIIMTFAGDYPFILVEETATKEDELKVTPTYGEPFLLVDTVGSLTDISYTWTSNGIEYYIVSDVMKTDQLLEVAKSLNVVSTISTK